MTKEMKGRNYVFSLRRENECHGICRNAIIGDVHVINVCFITPKGKQVILDSNAKEATLYPYCDIVMFSNMIYSIIL